MADKSNRLKARLPRGLADRGPAEIAATRRMIEAIRAVYERYGFDPVETPAIEYTDALGKFLPDLDRPNEGVFSFQDDDEQWLSLRYDLTAPLARHVAENFQNIALPYRSYRFGWVFRNEKPGPGRFRQFMQFDADTVGAASMAADAEICMMAADTMEALGIARGQYVVKVNNRKILDGVMEAVGLGGEANVAKRLTVLRAIDKLDRLGVEGVKQLLGPGRRDESGDFTRGAELEDTKARKILGLVDALVEALELGDNASEFARHRIRNVLVELDQLNPNDRRNIPTPNSNTPIDLNDDQVWRIFEFLRSHHRDDAIEVFKPSTTGAGSVRYPWGDQSYPSDAVMFRAWGNLVAESETGRQGVAELVQIAEIVRAVGFGPDQIAFDSSVVRGLEYYTGPVYEVELLLETKDEKGRPVRFGSVGGGGRYDGLVSRFRGQPVPATGFSIGVSRLQAALTLLGKLDTRPSAGPVLVTVMDHDRVPDYQKMVGQLRDAGIRAELYLGSRNHNVGQQLKYADRRHSPCAVIQGGDERTRGEVQIKDLILGATLTDAKDRDEYRRQQAEAQVAVPQDKLVEEVRKVLARHGVKWD